MWVNHPSRGGVNHPSRGEQYYATNILTSFTLNPGMNLGAKVASTATELQAFVKDYIFFLSFMNSLSLTLMKNYNEYSSHFLIFHFNYYTGSKKKKE